MTVEEPTTAAASPGAAGPARTAKRRPSDGSWVPLLGSAAIAAFLIGLIIIANLVKA